MRHVAFAAVLLMVGCHAQPPHERLTGDLYFGFFRISNLYNQPDSIVEKVTKSLDTMHVTEASGNSQEMLEEYALLKTEDLLFTPYVEIKRQDGSVVTLFVTDDQYSQLRKFRHEDLQKESKKVVITANVTKLNSRLFRCLGLDEIKKVDGVTRMKSGKFRIDDYE